MQRVKNMAYATAGVQMVPGIEMNVRSHVFIPDAEAGCDQARSYYRAESTVERKKEWTLPRNVARMFIVALIVVLGAVVLFKCVQRNALANTYAQTRTSIDSVEQSILEQKEELAQARDINRIRYLASNEYQMVSAISVESIPVTAPDTRPANSNTLGQAASSPLAGGHGIITGSR